MIRAATVAVLVAVLLWPELAWYRAERRLRAATTAFRVSVPATSGDERLQLLSRIDAAAMVVTEAQPGDSRALMLAGSSRLLARDASGAFSRYRAALARGERAEIVLALARAHLLAKDLVAAQADLLRAAWISPALARTLPREASRSLLREVKLTERALRRGRLAAPPPLAAADVATAR